MEENAIQFVIDTNTTKNIDNLKALWKNAKLI
jgi:hypothetical protein